MDFFSRKDYVSDITLLIEELKKQDPHLEAKQREGMRLLWDKNKVLENEKEFNADPVPQKPYVYQTD